MSKIYKTRTMKRYLLLSAASFCLLSGAFAQDKVEVPATVKKVFTDAYPNATKVKWTKDKDNYEVAFEENKRETIVGVYRQGRPGRNRNLCGRDDVTSARVRLYEGQL
jgi:hypothetical protein